MRLRRLALHQVGPIDSVDVTFGDLTVLLGPQASGKSIFLQFLKLLLDAGPIRATLEKHGYEWARQPRQFLSLYLGEGMNTLWTDGQSRLEANGQSVELASLLRRHAKDEQLFYVPAQRVLILGKGWPRPFTDYSPSDPFSVRDFSEKIRLLLEKELPSGEPLFPQRRLKSELRNELSQSIFARFQLGIEHPGEQKRLVLRTTADGTRCPTWSGLRANGSCPTAAGPLLAAAARQDRTPRQPGMGSDRGDGNGAAPARRRHDDAASA